MHFTAVQENFLKPAAVAMEVRNVRAACIPCMPNSGRHRCLDGVRQCNKTLPHTVIDHYFAGRFIWHEVGCVAT